MTVEAVMVKDVITVSMDDTLEQIRALFTKHKFHHVLVLDEGQLVGVISDRDILNQISPYIGTVGEDKRDLNTLKKRAHQIMTRSIVSISKSTSIEEAAQVLLRENISCLPVLSDAGDVEGIVTRSDLLNYYVFKKDKVEV